MFSHSHVIPLILIWDPYYNYGAFKEIFSCQETLKTLGQHIISFDATVVCAR